MHYLWILPIVGGSVASTAPPGISLKRSLQLKTVFWMMRHEARSKQNLSASTFDGPAVPIFANLTSASCSGLSRRRRASRFSSFLRLRSRLRLLMRSLLCLCSCSRSPLPCRGLRLRLRLRRWCRLDDSLMRTVC